MNKKWLIILIIVCGLVGMIALYTMNKTEPEKEETNVINPPSSTEESTSTNNPEEIIPSSDTEETSLPDDNQIEGSTGSKEEAIIKEEETMEMVPLEAKTSEEEAEYLAVRKVAWDDLSKAAQQSVIGDWKEAVLLDTKVIDVPLLMENEDLEVTDVYKVIFTTNQDELLGPIGVYIHPYTKRIIGYDARE